MSPLPSQRPRPTVSLIVRTRNRPTLLKEALASLAAQTYPAIEVVVINDAGDDVSELIAGFADSGLRIAARRLEQNVGRSRAANLGLELASGEWIGFLDDDDWLEPTHVEKLLDALGENPRYRFAYSGVRCVDGEGRELDRVFATPYDPVLLLAANSIPIHAALFSQKLLECGCRVDENLPYYEDWDFWIQLSLHTDFLFVPGHTAVYRLHDDQGQSGFGATGSAHPDRQALSLKVFAKWLPRLPETRLAGLIAAIEQGHANAGEARRLQQAIDLLGCGVREHLRKYEAQARLIATQQHEIAARDQRIAALINSRSWKITEPLRAFGRLARAVVNRVDYVKEVLRRNGGARMLPALFYNVWKKEGVRGLKIRLRRHVHGELSPSGFALYQQWLSLYGGIDDEARRRLTQQLDGLPRHPLISVVMPVFDPPPAFLDAAINSLRAQLYPHWQLCIADDASTNPAVRQLLERHAAEEPRIRLVFRPGNGHICEASNSALALASGEWVALFDHDDLLPEDALLHVAAAINRHPDLGLIYSDEDKIDENGVRRDPYFKSDFNRDLFYSQNMISHLGVYQRALVAEVGGFRKGLEGSQDYDLALRCLERLRPEQIHHIPRVLYHWRIHAQSTADSGEAKPYARIAGERALTEHFQRLRIAATVSSQDWGYRVHYALPTPPPLVSLIIPTRNAVDLLRKCIDSLIKKTRYTNYEIWVVDNGSDDPAALQYFSQIATSAKVRVIRDERPFNYSALNNAAVGQVRGEMIVLLNNDIEVISPDWLSEMVSQAARPEIGAVGAKLIFPDETIQHAGVVLGIGGVAAHAHKHVSRHENGYFGRANLIQNFSAVTAACLLVRKDLYLAMGGLNENELSVAFNDVDFCLRLAAAGYRNVYTPYAEFYHHESATRGQDDTPKKNQRFQREIDYMKNRWGDLLQRDPAYNPNLSLHHEDFRLAFPPRDLSP